MLKLARAEAHLKTLEQDIGRFLKGQGDLVAHQFDAEQGEKRWWIERKPDSPPPDWSLLIGEALYHLRSLLDHLAYELAGTNASDKTEFPIYKDTSEWEKVFHTYQRGVKGKLKGIRPQAVAIIKGLQPCFRTEGRPPHLDHLWLLHDFNNIDKHRRLHLVVLAKAGARITHPGTPLSAIWEHRGPVERGTVLARIPTTPEQEMNVEYEPSFDVDFRERVAGRLQRDATLSVRYELWAMWQTVGRVLERLEPFVPRLR